MKSSPFEKRTCTECKSEYEHEPIMLDGSDMIKHMTTCEPCSDLARLEYEKAERRRKAIIRWEDAIPEEYRKTRQDHPDYPTDTHRQASAWMRLSAGGDRKPFLGLVGPSGGCKSRIASQLARVAIWEGAHFQWCESYRFQWACQNQFGESGQEAGNLLRRWRETSNLIFDDIGSLKSTEIVSDTLYSLLEHRSSNGLPMIWTSNETPDEMLSGKGITEKARMRNVSRLTGFSEIIMI